MGLAWDFYAAPGQAEANPIAFPPQNSLQLGWVLLHCCANWEKDDSDQKGGEQGSFISCRNFLREFKTDSLMLGLTSELPGLWLIRSLSAPSHQEPDYYLDRAMKRQRGIPLIPVRSVTEPDTDNQSSSLSSSRHKPKLVDPWHRRTWE